MTMPWVQPQPKRSVTVGRRERNITSPSHPCFIVTGRCGHRWVTSGPFAETDLCVVIERMIDHHESLCSPPNVVHRPGW